MIPTDLTTLAPIVFFIAITLAWSMHIISMALKRPIQMGLTPPPPPKLIKPDTKKCPYCGSILPLSTTSCPNCAAKL